MASSDAAFLAEVEDFLCDLPSFALHESKESDVIDEAAPAAAVSATHDSVASAPSCPSTRAKKTKKTRNDVDAAAKAELARAKDRKKRSAYRDRQRIEKETLKQQIGELSMEVSTLQKAKRTVSSTAWEMVAKHQLQERINAEVEQRQLFTAVASRSKSIQEFRKFVHDRMSSVAMSQFSLDEEQELNQNKRIRVEPSDRDFFETYLRELDATYAETDNVLSNYGLDASEVSWSDPRHQWQEDDTTGYFIYTDKHLVPIEFEQARKGMWDTAHLHHRQEDRQLYDRVENPENTVAFRFRITKRLKSGRTVSVLQRAVARRYLEDNRMVVVWRTFTEGEALFTGMHADECGWCVSMPSSHTPESSTLFRTVMRHMPMHFSTPATAEPVAEQFTGLLLSAGTEDATEIGSRFEKLLLQDE